MGPEGPRPSRDSLLHFSVGPSYCTDSLPRLRHARACISRGRSPALPALTWTCRLAPSIQAGVPKNSRRRRRRRYCCRSALSPAPA